MVRSTDKLRILRISHSSIIPEYRQRDRELQKSYPVDIQVVIPKYWPHLGLYEQEGAEALTIRRCSVLGAGSIPLFAYNPLPLVTAICEFKPHLIDIHEEPYSSAGFEATWLTQQLAPKTACVFYTAQNIKKRYPPPYCWTEQYVMRQCRGAYPCSLGAQAVLSQKGFQKPAPVIPLGLDPDLFHPDQLCNDNQLDLSGFVIGYFGRFEESKGIADLFHALAAVGQQLDWTLLMVGTGTKKQALMSLGKSLGLEQRIRWIGGKPAKEIPSFLRLCQVTVIPSRTTPTWKEQFGRAATESMACGVPVIASDSGNLPVLVKGAGLIFPEGNIDRLASAILTIARTPDLHAGFRNEGLRLVESNYTWQVVAAATFQFYQSVLDKKLLP